MIRTEYRDLAVHATQMCCHWPRSLALGSFGKTITMWPRLISNSLSSWFLSVQSTNMHHHGRSTCLEDRRKERLSFIRLWVIQRRQGESSMEDNFGEEDPRGVVLKSQKEELGWSVMRNQIFLSEATREVLQISVWRCSSLAESWRPPFSCSAECTTSLGESRRSLAWR